MRRRRAKRHKALCLLLWALGLRGIAQAQDLERVTFDDAVRRAVSNHPTVQQAAAGILRAQAVYEQVRSISRPALDASLTTNVIGPVTSFGGENIIPRVQTSTAAAIGVPLITPVSWAQRTQAADQIFVAERTADEARRQVAIAAAQAYLSVIAQRRVLELNERARDNARAHYDYANQRYEGGIGSRLNAVRALQELSSDEARVEDARLALRRAQEALGVLVAADTAVDAAGEPDLPVPLEPVTSIPGRPFSQDLSRRSDIRQIAARQTAAERVADDSWKDRLPSVTALFAPQMLAPRGLFADARSFRAALVFSVPLFDAGQRRGRERERLALVDVVRAERANAERQAVSEIRTAQEAIQSTERALERANAAAQQANDVVQITDVAFREGATTNIEVIDAQRGARDAETAAVIAEDAVRRARLELLVATGRFPQ